MIKLFGIVSQKKLIFIIYKNYYSPLFSKFSNKLLLIIIKIYNINNNNKNL